MKQTIDFKEGLIRKCKSVWEISVDPDDQPRLRIRFQRKTNLLITCICCQNFDQITPLKHIAEGYTRKNAALILKGDPITLEPAISARKEG